MGHVFSNARPRARTRQRTRSVEAVFDNPSRPPESAEKPEESSDQYVPSSNPRRNDRSPNFFPSKFSREGILRTPVAEFAPTHALITPAGAVKVMRTTDGYAAYPGDGVMVAIPIGGRILSPL